MPILFSRKVQPAFICLPSRNGQGGRSCTCDLRSEQGRLLLTLHPENGCQTWTRTKTSGLTGRRATLTLPGNGAADRIPTCIVPFRRRMPHVFDHSSNLKLVGMAGLDFPSLAKCFPTRDVPKKMADPKGVAPSTLPQTTGRSAN